MNNELWSGTLPAAMDGYGSRASVRRGVMPVGPLVAGTRPTAAGRLDVDIAPLRFVICCVCL